jgi:hypothetical protein
MKNSKKHLFKTTSIGSIALEILSNDQDAYISGSTSKGIFIKTSSKWLVFLSFDPFRGPLTITLDEVDSTFKLVSIGNRVKIGSQSISFPSADFTITGKGGEVWKPVPPSTLPLKDARRQHQLINIAEEVMSKKNGVGLSQFLLPLLGLSNADPSPRLIIDLKWTDILQIQKYIRNKKVASLARLLSNFLGMGPGLTPSADDFIIGILLSLNRWQNLLWTADSLRDLNLQVVEAAYQKTTTLSANLIECAAFGLADERLIDALDWIVTGTARELNIVAHLLEWGNSSGVDAFVGMAVALSPQ